MGCDIHMYCEKYNERKDKWICTDHFQYNEYYGDDGFEPLMNIVPIYDNRDYATFEALAGVRGYYGNDTIDEPRGLPDDVSYPIYNEYIRWGNDGHSHSWLTAKELFDYKEKHPFINYSGLLSKDQVKDLDNGILPTSWCQGCSDPSYERRSWKEEGCVLDRLIECVKERMKEEFYVWDFLSEEDKEEKYKKHAEDFRIVFWFDN